MNLYVYCICDLMSEDLDQAAQGLYGSEVQAIDREGLIAVVSQIEPGTVAVTRENVRAHSQVNAVVLKRTTQLPFRFGTVITDSQLNDYLTKNSAGLRDALRRVRGCVEMGVKIMLSDSEANREADRPPEKSAQLAAGRGTAFLLAKQREIFGEQSERKRADELAAWLAGEVSTTVRDSQVAVRPSRSLVVRAAHLVERGLVDEYRTKLRGLENKRRADLNFLTSGPWPPYSFTEIN